MCKVLIVGCDGNMGRRYAAIFRMLGVKFIGIDVWPKIVPTDITHCLICTPTDTHIETIEFYGDIYPDASFLIEKPLAMEFHGAMDNLVGIYRDSAYIVNNWAHVFGDQMLFPDKCDVQYNYFQTGPHGLFLDCCQLIYLAEDMEHCDLQCYAPVFNAVIDGKVVTREDIDASYIRMIRYWLEGNEVMLWDLLDAMDMQEKVEFYERHMGTSTESTD